MKLRASYASALAALLAILIAPAPENGMHYEVARDKAQLNANAQALIDYLAEDLQAPGYIPLSADKDLNSWPEAEAVLPQIDVLPPRWDDTPVEINPTKPVRPWELVPPGLDRFQMLTPYLPGSSRFVVEPYTPEVSEIIGFDGMPQPPVGTYLGPRGPNPPIR